MDHNFAEEEAYLSQEDQKKVAYRKPKKRQELPKKEVERPVVYWKRSGGKDLNVDHMSQEHLRNALRFIVTNDLLKTKSSPNNTLPEDVRLVLLEAKDQIEYLHQKFTATGSGNQVVAKIVSLINRI
jgi:hypothetical protein